MSSFDAARVAALLADSTARRVHESERGEVWRVSWEGQPAALKIDRPQGLRSRLGRRLRGSRARRAEEAALALQELGFQVSRPLARLEEEERSIQLAEWIEAPTLSAALAEIDVPGGRVLALAVAELCARLHEAGVRARDLKPPNLLVSGSPEEPRLTLIDLDDVRVARHVPRRWALRNLIALDAYAQVGPRPLGVRARHTALTRYCELRGWSLAQTLPLVLEGSRQKRSVLEARARTEGA